MTHNRSCPACEITLSEACVQQVPLPLCGVCKLLDQSMWETYFGRWNPSVADLIKRKDAASCCSQCT
jgi:hypothetical protein